MTADLIVDLTGLAITEIRAFPAVAAIVADRVGSEFKGTPNAWGPPAVIVEGLGIDYNPGGGTRRLRLQAPTFIAKCYGATRPQASQLANAVVAAMNLRGPRVDTGGRLVLRSDVDSGGDVALDPVTKWPHADVVFHLLGAQQARPIE